MRWKLGRWGLQRMPDAYSDVMLGEGGCGAGTATSGAGSVGVQVTCEELATPGWEIGELERSKYFQIRRFDQAQKGIF